MSAQTSLYHFQFEQNRKWFAKKVKIYIVQINITNNRIHEPVINTVTGVIPFDYVLLMAPILQFQKDKTGTHTRKDEHCLYICIVVSHNQTCLIICLLKARLMFC